MVGGDTQRVHEDRFREALIREREAQGVSQAELARRVGKSQQWLWKVEKGGQSIGLEQAVELAHAIDVTPDQLLAGGIRTKAEWRRRHAELRERYEALEDKIGEHRAELQELELDAMRIRAELSEANKHLHPANEKERS